MFRRAPIFIRHGVGRLREKRSPFRSRRLEQVPCRSVINWPS